MLLVNFMIKGGIIRNLIYGKRVGHELIYIINLDASVPPADVQATLQIIMISMLFLLLKSMGSRHEVFFTYGLFIR